VRREGREGEGQEAASLAAGYSLWYNVP